MIIRCSITENAEKRNSSRVRQRKERLEMKKEEEDDIEEKIMIINMYLSLFFSFKS